MENKRKKDVMLTAVGGVVTALTFVLCALGGVLTFAKIIAPAFCGLMLAVIGKYVSFSVAVMSYAASAVLLLLFSPDKATALMFISLFGYYPMAFGSFEKIRAVSLRIILKTLLFTAVGAVALYLGIRFMALGENELFRKYWWAIGILCGTLMLSYDRFIFHTFRIMENEWDVKLKKFFRKII